MDPYELFTAFLAKVIQRLGTASDSEHVVQAIEVELTELRLRDQFKWMQFHGQFRSLVEPPATGAIEQQVVAAKSLLDYLVYQTKTNRPELIAPTVAAIDRHYHLYGDELRAAIDEYTYDGASDSARVEDFLTRLNRTPH